MIEKFREGGGHANVVAVLSHGWLIEDENYFIDMDLFAFSLRDFLEHDFKSTLGTQFFDPPSRVGDLACLCFWNLTEQIAHGLEFIHEKREVHRDVKPENG